MKASQLRQLRSGWGKTHPVFFAWMKNGRLPDPVEPGTGSAEKVVMNEEERAASACRTVYSP
jgi:hypothetical protein